MMVCEMRQLVGEESLVPLPRGTLPRTCACFLAAMVVALLLMMAPEDFIGLLATSMLMLTTGPLLHGVCLLMEEWLFRSSTRYRGRLLTGQMLLSCVGGRTLLSLGLAGLLLALEGDHQTEGGRWKLVVLLSVLYIPLKNLEILGPCQVEVSAICEEKKNNVAHGLAWSFYLGYLKLVLPHLENSIASFRTTHSAGPFEKRGSRRLLILLPLNANIAQNLEDEDTNIQFYDNLPNIELDRAGVRGRVYKHSVYSVLDENGKSHQCAMEYATSLMTLYQMSHESNSGFGERERREQVLLFYRTLQDILEHSLDCRNRYTLILLNDEREDDPHFLSKTILSHLLQQEREEYCLTPHPHQDVGHILTPAQPGGGHQCSDAPMSVDPELMISQDLPRSLKDPVETSDV
ncbi:stimulator of interferon genes protein isoform X2 [Osmerus eperlanus]|uniref:stimulator of interferon genes protein isoform X2 n=1 Tax=Osmerus eperlanus TaxID=29151 RepID=UPI002E1016A3